MTANYENDVPLNEQTPECELAARLRDVAQHALHDLSEDDAAAAQGLCDEMELPWRCVPREALEDRETRHNTLRELAEELASGDAVNMASLRALVRRLATGGSPRWHSELRHAKAAFQYPHILLSRWAALHLDNFDSPIHQLWPAGNTYETRESIDRY